MYKSAKLPISALRHVLRVLLLQPSGPSGGATIKPPGAVKLGVGAELRPAASLGVALGGNESDESDESDERDERDERLRLPLKNGEVEEYSGTD